MRMIPGFRASLVLALLICMSATIASAQITPSDDSYTLTSTPTTNYGAKTTLEVESAGATTFVRFDLSSIPSSVTGSMVAKATLKIYVSTVTTAGSFNVDLVTSPWTESTITADNTPTLGSAVATAIPITSIRDRDEHVGFVAQDVQRVIPEAVTENSKGYLLVNNDPILWTMLNAIKEQQREIASLRGQLRRRPSSTTKPAATRNASDNTKDEELRAVRQELTQLRNKDSRREARLAQLERTVGTLNPPAITVALASSATTESH